MKSWKQAFWLAKSEWKVSIVNIFLSWLILTIVTLIFLTSFNRYMEENYIGFDIFFLLVFSFGPFLFRSKYFQYKNVSGHIWASPTLIMQAQLPIPKDILAKSRLIIYFAYLLPFILTIFPIMYIGYSPIREVLSLPVYLVFVIIWICYCLYFGILLPASDVGDYATPKRMTYYFIFSFIIFFGIFIFFYKVLGYGIVAWTIRVAQNWPFLAIIISVILLVVSWKFMLFYMKKTMKKLDYM